MNVDKLLFELEAISTVLKNPDLQTTSPVNKDVDQIVERFHELVEEIKLQRNHFSFQNQSSKKLLIELSTLIDSLISDCGIKLDLLKFVDQIKPLN